MKFVSEITKFGLRPGIICNTFARNCVHFSIDTYDPVQYAEAAKRLAEGDLSLPARIGYPPRGDCELILNYDAVYESDHASESLRCYSQSFPHYTMAVHRSGYR